MEDNEKKILINVEDDETRIAVVDNATLDNLYIEQTHRTQILGNIYFGKVVKIQPSFQAAFVDYGAPWIFSDFRHQFTTLQTKPSNQRKALDQSTSENWTADHGSGD